MKKVVNTIQIFCSLFLISFCTYGQTLFNGGNGDGFSKKNKDATTLENTSLVILYQGSNGDGYSNRLLSATTLENTSLAVLYEGSNGDGFSNRLLSATTLENTSLAILYDGSNGDGFSNKVLSATTLENTSLAILYDGSNGDGFSRRLLSATTLDNTSLTILYDGSNGDGFSRRLLSATTLDNTSLAILYDGSNGDGFSVAQESVFLDPNQIVDLRLQASVFLQGPRIDEIDSGLMNDYLRTTDLIPTTSPYADGALITNVNVFNDGGISGTGLPREDIVDWVWIEIRSGSDDTLVVDGTSALLRRNGEIVGLDGMSDVILRGLAGDYFIVIKHRNHLGVMTANKFALSTSSTAIDLTNSSTSTFGSNARVQLSNGDMALWAGNTNGDNFIQYSGVNPDVPNILSFVLNDPANFLNFPTFMSIEYSTSDVDLNATIQYSGTEPDTPLILQNVLSHPGNFLNFSTYQIQEQLPEN